MDEDVRKEPIFPTHKTNMPKNYAVPEGLKVFLNSVKSELTDPRNRNKEECNLPVDEINALKQLIQLQKDRKIVIKACDKGAGIIILNFDTYMKACYDHLLSKTDYDIYHIIAKWMIWPWKRPNKKSGLPCYLAYHF